MIPYLLAAVGGYLLGDSMKDSQTFADGGMMAKGGMAKNVTDKSVVDFTISMEESNLVAKGAHKNEQYTTQIKNILSLSKKDIDKMKNAKVSMIYDEYQNWLETNKMADGGKITLNLSKIKNKFNIPDVDFEKVKIAYDKTGNYENATIQAEGTKEIADFKEKYPTQYDDVLIYLKQEFSNSNNYDGYQEPQINWDLFAPKKKKKKIADGGMMADGGNC